MAKETAEEKLMRMMQKSASPAAAKPAAPVKKKPAFTFTIGLLNMILMAAIVCCILGLLFEMRSGMSLINQDVEFPADVKTSMSLSDLALPSTQDADYYLQKINERNIFKPYVPKTNKKAAVQGLVQKMSKYKLVGISWLDLPETASIMIEDTQKKATFFLKQGEQLDGVTVKTIYTDRAVFSHENEETTIKL